MNTLQEVEQLKADIKKLGPYGSVDALLFLPHTEALSALLKEELALPKYYQRPGVITAIEQELERRKGWADTPLIPWYAKVDSPLKKYLEECRKVKESKP